MAKFVVDMESGAIVSTNLVVVDESDLPQVVADQMAEGVSDSETIKIAEQYGYPVAVR